MLCVMIGLPQYSEGLRPIETKDPSVSLALIMAGLFMQQGSVSTEPPYGCLLSEYPVSQRPSLFIQ
jgi:hypothetical protein